MNITEFERELNDLRMGYLESLANEYDTDIETVLFMAEILGPSEDFDALVTSLQDGEGRF